MKKPDRVFFKLMCGHNYCNVLYSRGKDKSNKMNNQNTTANHLSEIGLYNFNMKEYGKLKTFGVTDQFTSCCCCGKQNLKKTVVMQDSEGNYSFFGSTCAYKASGNYFQSKHRTRRIRKSTFDELIKDTLVKK